MSIPLQVAKNCATLGSTDDTTTETMVCADSTIIGGGSSVGDDGDDGGAGGGHDGFRLESLSDVPTKFFQDLLVAVDGDADEALRKHLGVQQGEHTPWRVEDFVMDDHSLGVKDERSHSEMAADDHSFRSGVEDATTTVKQSGDYGVARGEVIEKKTKKKSKRDTLKTLREERAAERKRKLAMKREALLLKGGENCDVTGCCEPRASAAKRICLAHRSSAQLDLAGLAGFLESLRKQNEKEMQL